MNTPTDPATFRPSLNTQTAKSERELLLERKLESGRFWVQECVSILMRQYGSKEAALKANAFGPQLFQFIFKAHEEMK